MRLLSRAPRAAVYGLEFVLAKKLQVGALAFLCAHFALRAAGARSWHPLAPAVSSLLVWSAYLENLTTDAREDGFNAHAPHGLSSAVESRLWAVEKLYPAFYCLALALALSISARCFAYALCAALLFSGYVQKWIPAGAGRRKRLKDFYVVKNVVPPLCWCLACLAVPFADAGIALRAEHAALTAMGFLFGLREEVKFDIPDAAGDARAGIRTFPNALGEARTKRLIDALGYAATLVLFGTLLLLWDGGKTEQLDALLKNALPLLTAFANDRAFTDALFETRRKEYCNLGLLWGGALLAVHLAVPYPRNIAAFLALRLAGNVLARPLVDRALLGPARAAASAAAPHPP